jgi:CCS family citrate carrier protein
MSEQADRTEAIPPVKQQLWPQAWWKLMEMRIGIIPVPVLVALLAIVGHFLRRGRLPTEISMMIAVIAVGGCLCGELGKRLPLLRNIGGGAVLATFLPSALVYYKLLPASISAAVTEFTVSTRFLYVFITAVIVGSILGMDRTVLVRGWLKIFAPLTAGSIAAAAVGTGIGTALGLGAKDTLLFVVVPIMSGGIGEGAIPLSTGYAEIMHFQQNETFARVLPAVMFGSLTAILLSGLLNFVGKKYPHLTGEGRLQPHQHDSVNPTEHEGPADTDLDHVAAAGMFGLALYLAGLAGQDAVHLPAPITMLFLAVVAKITSAVPAKTQEGAFVLYRFFRVAVTYPLLFAMGVALTPWDKLIEALHWKNLVTIASTVATLMATGWFVGRWINLYPIESAIVNACHSGQGGTGDVAILTASNRMILMPFAQVATRIGGAITVTLTLLVLRALS